LGWQIRYGKQIGWFNELEEKGEHIPAMDERVDLFSDMAVFYNSWSSLSPSRQAGMGLGYIQYETITDYLNEERIFEYIERMEYRYWISKIDGVYVGLRAEEDEKKHDAKAKAKNKPTKL
jgi:hypothetical protein